MGLVGSLWNPDTQARLQRIHRRTSRHDGVSPSSVRSHPTFKRRRVGQIRATIMAILAGRPGGMRLQEIAAAAVAQLDEPIPTSTIKSCLSREAQNPCGAFERVGRGRYRLRSSAE